jgi:hypothetical protein
MRLHGLHCAALKPRASRNLDQKAVRSTANGAVLILASIINHNHPQQSLIQRQNKVLTIV